MAGKRYLGPARIDLKGDRAYASRYVPRGRVLLQRALDALADDAKRASVVRELQTDGVLVEAYANPSGLSIRIDTSAITAEDCCTYESELPSDPRQEEPLADDEMFGDPRWGDFECGDELPNPVSWYTSTPLPSLNPRQFFSEQECSAPCPQDQDPDGFGFFGVGILHCNAVSREWQFDGIRENGGNNHRVFLTACVNRLSKTPIPLFLDVYVDVTEDQESYDWDQYQVVHDGPTTDVDSGQTGNNDCTDAWGDIADAPLYYSEKWWEIEKVRYNRVATLRINLIVGSSTYPIFDMSIVRDRYSERVVTTFKVDNRTIRELGFVDRCGGGSCLTTGCCPQSFTLPPVGNGWEDAYNIFRDETTFSTSIARKINSCPKDEFEEEEDVPDGIYQQESPNGNCVRCVVYRDNEIVCTGEWQTRQGEPCADPGTEPSEEEEPEDWIEDEETPESERERQPDESPTNEPIDEHSLGWDGEPSWPDSLLPDGTDAVREYQDEQQTTTPDIRQTNVLGILPPDRYRSWATELLTLPVSAFQTWRPSNLIQTVTGGRKCNNT